MRCGGEDSQTAITNLFKLKFPPKKVKMCLFGAFLPSDPNFPMSTALNRTHYPV